MINYTAKYTKIDAGYMGQLIEWPEIVMVPGWLINKNSVLSVPRAKRVVRL